MHRWPFSYSRDYYVEHISAELENIAQDTPYTSETDDRDDDYIEVRLRVFNGNWELKVGNPQFDLDHRG